MTLEDKDEEDFISDPFENIYPMIYEGVGLPRPGFNAVTIYLDGRIKSNLDWTKQKELALQAIQNGYRIFWDLDLGLFHQLVHPLAQESQFLSLVLSLEHFRDTLWKEFRSHSLGLSLYRGSADFSHDLQFNPDQENNWIEWMEQFVNRRPTSQLNAIISEEKNYFRLFCRDVAMEYIGLLAARLPESLAAYVFLDAGQVSISVSDQLQLLHPERFGRLQVALKGNTHPMDVLGLGKPSSRGYSGEEAIEVKVFARATTAVCIPPLHFVRSEHYHGMDEAVEELEKRGVPFKFIPEGHLTTEWDELDFLVYYPGGLSKEGKRKLNGFCAAGGTVVSISEVQGFPQELQFEEWIALVTDHAQKH